MSGGEKDLSALTMTELFALEVEEQTGILSDGLLALEQGEEPKGGLSEMMRAAHSIKGGARITGVHAAVDLAHAVEDFFTAAGQDRSVVTSEGISILFEAVDLLQAIAKSAAEEGGFRQSQADKSDALTIQVRALAGDESRAESGRELDPVWGGEDPLPHWEEDYAPEPEPEPEPVPKPEPEAGAGEEAKGRTVRVEADVMDRLFSLSGELSVESRHLEAIRHRFNTGRRWAMELTARLNELAGLAAEISMDERAAAQVDELRNRSGRLTDWLNEAMDALEIFDHRAAGLTREIATEITSHRMRPFGEGLGGLARLVRDVSRSLGKKAVFQVEGETTLVDRDILEKLASPLAHLVQNAIDHGLESPAERLAAGKPEKGLIRLRARHKGGLLSIELADDGRGIDLEQLKQTIIKRGLSTPEMVETMEAAEVLEFTFLPGFSLKDEVSKISGRGVGLDVVRSMVHQVRGSVRVQTLPGQGTEFELVLPLTLAVMRALMVEISGEAYAFPIGRVLAAFSVEPDQVREFEGRQYVDYEDRRVGLIQAAEALELKGRPLEEDKPMAVVALEQGKRCYGLVVDGFLGEKELVEKPLDPRLGKVQDISSASILEDGRPALIFDVDDLTGTIEKLIERAGPASVRADKSRTRQAAKRVLVVDDSITVREVERNLLTARGYEVAVAVDGMDGWNTLRRGRFDLVITDVDMPRLDGIELVKMIRRDPRLADLPVMIVSYKDRDQDRVRGLDAGADQYITKGSFHDETLVQSVVDLIGRA